MKKIFMLLTGFFVVFSSYLFAQAEAIETNGSGSQIGGADIVQADLDINQEGTGVITTVDSSNVLTIQNQESGFLVGGTETIADVTEAQTIVTFLSAITFLASLDTSNKLTVSTTALAFDISSVAKFKLIKVPMEEFIYLAYITTGNVLEIRKVSFSSFTDLGLAQAGVGSTYLDGSASDNGGAIFLTWVDNATSKVTVTQSFDSGASFSNTIISSPIGKDPKIAADANAETNEIAYLFYIADDGSNKPMASFTNSTTPWVDPPSALSDNASSNPNDVANTASGSQTGTFSWVETGTDKLFTETISPFTDLPDPNLGVDLGTIKSGSTTFLSPSSVGPIASFIADTTNKLTVATGNAASTSNLPQDWSKSSFGTLESQLAFSVALGNGRSFYQAVGGHLNAVTTTILLNFGILGSEQKNISVAR